MQSYGDGQEGLGPRLRFFDNEVLYSLFVYQAIASIFVYILYYSPLWEKRWIWITLVDRMVFVPVKDLSNDVYNLLWCYFLGIPWLQMVTWNLVYITRETPNETMSASESLSCFTGNQSFGLMGKFENLWVVVLKM